MLSLVNIKSMKKKLPFLNLSNPTQSARLKMSSPYRVLDICPKRIKLMMMLDLLEVTKIFRMPSKIIKLIILIIILLVVVIAMELTHQEARMALPHPFHSFLRIIIALPA